jgi:hypothetical protein
LQAICHNSSYKFAPNLTFAPVGTATVFRPAQLLPSLLITARNTQAPYAGPLTVLT